MGFSLHIQRANGREADLVEVDLPMAMEAFLAIPWKEEISEWDKVPDDEAESRRPLYQIFDDSGNALHVTAYSEDKMGVYYTFPQPASPFGVSYEDDEGCLGTDQYPRSELQGLFECFFASDRQAMRSLLGRHPMVEEEQEHP